MEQMTVKQLIAHLQMVVKNNPSVADKYIVVADDNEGNGYHGMFFGLTFDQDQVKDIIEFSNGLSDSEITDTTKLAVLG
jgi:hypothetical protein